MEVEAALSPSVPHAAEAEAAVEAVAVAMATVEAAATAVAAGAVGQRAAWPATPAEATVETAAPAEAALEATARAEAAVETVGGAAVVEAEMKAVGLHPAAWAPSTATAMLAAAAGGFPCLPSIAHFGQHSYPGTHWPYQ